MRTAVCPRCGSKRLKWAQNELGMRYLVEFVSGREHYLTCPGVKPGTEREAPKMPERSKPSAPSMPASIPSNGDEGEGEQFNANGPTDNDNANEFDGEAEREAQAKADTGAQSGDSPESTSAEGDSEGEQEQEGESEGSAEGKPKRTPTGRAPKREGTDHKLQPTLNRWVGLRLNIMLVGPPGGGKTEGARRAAASIGIPYFERSMGPQTSQWDLVGFVGPNGNYVPSVAYIAFKDGGVLMLDEMDAASEPIGSGCPELTHGQWSLHIPQRRASEQACRLRLDRGRQHIRARR